jgi:hypothetical protein
MSFNSLDKKLNNKINYLIALSKNIRKYKNNLILIKKNRIENVLKKYIRLKLINVLL